MNKNTEKPYLELKNVSKRFRRNMTNFIHIIQFVCGIRSSDDFFAVNDVSFKLGPGETLGIIGLNGSGKSTILKLIAKITHPTHGQIERSGKIGALIEVGAGFHPELTGHENIYLYGSILGMSKNEIENKYDSIVDFAELHQSIHSPVKFYSSGMYARLGFAITVHVNLDILIVDEMLAVGDVAFQEKCFTKIAEFSRNGKIVVIVSQYPSLIEKYTQKALWLHEGKIKDFGPSRQLIQRFEKTLKS